ncbi:hypothetical protein JM82_2106 [Olleya sp. Hel_I_94]|nr:hypothetical protein JM82_2106 [Olleya sp. Hel_I_94]
MKKIENPGFRIIKTLPSTLGTVDFHIVMYEKLDFSDDEVWKGVNESEIAEEIYESGEYKGFYVIHSSTTRGEDINTLDDSEKLFCFNRINCDSILSYHCLATRSDETGFKLRIGFHEMHPEMSLPKIINDWNSMANISNGFQEIKINKDTFFELYQKQVEIWKKQITRCIKHS